MKLSDILAAGSGNYDLRKLWNETTPTSDLAPLPAGEYVAHVVDGKLDRSRTNATPGYKLTFRVIEGPHNGRLLWHDCWLTPAALARSMGDLAKLGITTLEQMDQPLPRWIRVRCKVVVRNDDDGTARNRVRAFDAIGLDQPEQDPFAPDAAVLPEADQAEGASL